MEMRAKVGGHCSTYGRATPMPNAWRSGVSPPEPSGGRPRPWIHVTETGVSVRPDVSLVQPQACTVIGLQGQSVSLSG